METVEKFGTHISKYIQDVRGYYNEGRHDKIIGMFISIALPYAAQERIHLFEVQDQNSPTTAHYLQRNPQETVWSLGHLVLIEIFWRKQLRSD